MTATKFSIRPALKSDLPVILQLFVAAIEASCADDYTPEQIEAWTSSVNRIDRWEHRLAEQYFIIAYAGDDIIGFASLQGNDYVDLLFVHKDFQKQGVANLLYAAIEVEAIKKGGVLLSANVSITARPFFGKNGFEVLFEQNNLVQGVELINYRMVKVL